MQKTGHIKEALLTSTTQLSTLIACSAVFFAFTMLLNLLFGANVQSFYDFPHSFQTLVFCLLGTNTRIHRNGIGYTVQILVRSLVDYSY